MATPSAQHQTFAKWLGAAMERFGIGVSELALRCHVSAAHVSLIRRGQRRPSQDLAALMASVLNEESADAMAAAGYSTETPAEESPKRRQERWAHQLALTSASCPIESLLTETLDCVADRVSFDYGSISRVDWESKEIDILAFRIGSAKASAGSPAFISDPWPVTRGITGHVASTGQMRRVDDVRKDAHYLRGWKATRSEMVVPLILVGTVVGVLNLESETLAAFTREDEQALAEVLPIIATSIVRWRDFQQLQELRRQLQGLAQLHEMRLDQQNEPTLLQQLAEKIIGLFAEFDLCVIRMSDRSKERLLLRAVAHRYHEHLNRAVGLRLPFNGSRAGQALLSNNKPVTVRDVMSDSGFGNPELAVRYRLRGMIVVPIPAPSGDEFAIGTIAVYATSIDRRFQATHERLLTDIARYVGVVLTNRRTSLRLEANLGTAALCIGGSRERYTLDHLCALICEKTGAKGASIFLVTGAGGPLRLSGTTGIRGVRNYEDAPTIPFGTGKTGWVAQHRRPLRLIRDDTQDELAAFEHVSESFALVEQTPSADKYQGFVAVPILKGHNVEGVIRVAMGRDDSLDFTPFDEALLVEVAGQLASAMAREDALAETLPASVMPSHTDIGLE